LLKINFERQGGGTYFDGENGNNITINLSGTLMFRENNDTYLIPDINDPTLHPPFPMI
jgi:hypothetical protein